MMGAVVKAKKSYHFLTKSVSETVPKSFFAKDGVDSSFSDAQ